MLNVATDDLPENDSGGPDLSGEWLGFAPDGPTPDVPDSSLYIEQHGSFIRANVVRRAGDEQRFFDYEGRFTAGQLVLFFEEKQGRGFLVGSVVMRLLSDLRTLSGRVTYFSHTQTAVVSPARIYRRKPRTGTPSDA